MRAFRQLLTAKASNWAVCLLSASLIAVALSNWSRPAPVSAQGGGAGAAARRPVDRDSRAVLNALEDAFVNIAETVEPSVVTIVARANPSERTGRPMQGPDTDERVPEPFRDFFRNLPRPDSPGESARSAGSGVIIRESGDTAFVLTNNHVVANRQRFTIKLRDGAEVQGQLVGADEKTDLAILKFRPKKPLPAGSVARMGDSDRVKVGQWAVAIGSPLGYESTLTVGVISAKGRELSGLGRNSYTDLIQTDASINPGNSGGPLVNIDGEVVGINVAIAASGMSQGNIGIGFAIPVNAAKMVSEQLIAQGKVVRGYLGVLCSQLNRELPEELREHLGVPTGGALCETVAPDTPASKAGLKDGDVIVKFGDRAIHSFSDLEKAVSVIRPGTAVPLEVVRDRKPVRLNITVAERPAESTLRTGPEGRDSAPRPPAGNEPVKTKFGLSVRPAETGTGAQIVSVAPGSPAEDAGLSAGDVIVQAGNTPVDNVAGLQKALDAVPAGQGVVLRVKTAQGLRFVVIRP